VRIKKLKKSDSDFDRLKELLLSDELEKLAELESNLQKLKIESNDEKAIEAKILPLFDQMLLERLQSKEQEIITILSDYLAEIIAKTSERDPEALSRSLQSILASSVKKEIASNKDAMIDSLYPIMGGMISKYVTSAIRELMETINRKIDEGLSVERIKRKIKSKITGVSETELLLEESGEALVSSLFIIHKKSGILISEAHLQESEIDDPSMIASMASAIKDFINDWIKSDTEHDEIQLLSYGNATLYIESAGSVYMIAFMDAEPDQEQRAEINRFFASLVKEYMEFLQHFDGDDSSKEISALSQKLQTFLNKQKVLSHRLDRQPQSKMAQYLLAVLFLILLIPFGYWIEDQYIVYRIESEIVEKTGYPIHIKIKDQSVIAEGSVNTFTALNTVERIIHNHNYGEIVNHITIPMIQVEKLYLGQRARIDNNISMLSRQVLKMEKSIAATNSSVVKLASELEKQMFLNRKIRSELLEKEDKLSVMAHRKKQIKTLLSLKKNIDKKLKASFSKNLYFNPENDTLVFSSNRFFPKGKVTLREDSKKIIENTTIKYLSVLLSVPEMKKYLRHIYVSGYTDSDGTFQYNKKLSTERAEVVKELLAGLEYFKKHHLSGLLKAKGYADQNRIMVNGIEDKNASRRTEIRFELDDAQISDDLKKLIQ